MSEPSKPAATDALNSVGQRAKPQKPEFHPFADLIDLEFQSVSPGKSRLALTVAEKHLNPNRVAHGAVAYALADTGMGSALYATLQPGEACATIEIKISYFKPVRAGRLVCKSGLINRAKTIGNLESRLYVDDVLVAHATGHFAIFAARV